MSHPTKSFGRSRGRARGEPPAAKKEKIPSQSAPPLNIQAARPGEIVREASSSQRGTGALGRAGLTSQAQSAQRPVQSQVAPMPAAAPVMEPQQAPLSSGGGVGGGGDSSTLGRGALRGRRVINPELLFTRPKTLVTKQGSRGRPVQLQANYFKMLTSTDWCLYKYDVAFSHEEDRTVVKKGLVRLHKERLGGYIFDGTTLYTSNRLPQPLELVSTRVSDNTIITMNVRLVGDMVKGDENYLQFFNIIMRKCLEYLRLQLVGRNFFDARNKVEVKQYNLELWPGYETSIRQHEHDILMCTEIRHKVMRQQTLLDLLQNCYQRSRGGYQDAFKAMVIGSTVLTDYNNNTYRIDDVAFDVSPSSTFERKGEKISYQDYYRTRYQITIRDPNQPLLLSRTKPRERRAGLSEFVYLVPELCRSTGLTDDMRNDKTMMRELANYTRLDPKGRVDRLLSFNKRLQDQPDVVSELTQWNMTLEKKLINVPARVLDPEDIVFGRGTTASAGPQGDWTRELRFKEMLVSPRLQDWVIIVPNRCAADAQAFLRTMKASVSKMNFVIGDPRPYVINDDRANSYTAAIEEIMSRANPQLIMCVVTNNRADRYSAIKKKCCIDRPVPTQCILQKNLNSKGVQSIATKVAVQLNCKIGGAPWSTVIPASDIMVAGFDVCHDTNTKGCDFGALVASLDKGLSRYFSAVSAHKNGEELSNDLAANMCKAVYKYKELNKTLPNRIIMYRDGVGEGQIPFVFEHEVENVKKKVGALYPDPSKLRLAYIIVTKRINTRLFFNGTNPPPGTVVDDVITNPNKYDFFIVSQFVKQGSVSPTGYSVISDNVGLDASQIQRFTYKLHHMYFNWSGTVRVPAPCQFAHKLAFLVSQSIHASPSNHLDTLLYFL